MTIKKTVTGSLTEAEIIAMIEEKTRFRVSNLQLLVTSDGHRILGDLRLLEIAFEVDESQPVKKMIPYAKESDYKDEIA